MHRAIDLEHRFAFFHYLEGQREKCRLESLKKKKKPACGAAEHNESNQISRMEHEIAKK